MAPTTPTRMLLSGFLGAALLFPVPLAAPAAADARIIDYHGLRLTLPDGWRVVDLDRDPTACLRLDLPTLYLGHAGTQSACTGRAVADRADTLHLEPLDGAPPRADIPTIDVRGAAVPSVDEAPADSNELRYELRRAGVMATVSYGAKPDLVRVLLAAAARALPAPPPGPGAAVAEP
ncbi:hypothetical protein ACWGJJ_28875, partial [Streptomyces sp. NPDC054787]